eukprot:366538-Chlamydomonas_euryale.AAC.15
MSRSRRASERLPLKGGVEKGGEAWLQGGTEFGSLTSGLRKDDGCGGGGGGMAALGANSSSVGGRTCNDVNGGGVDSVAAVLVAESGGGGCSCGDSGGGGGLSMRAAMDSPAGFLPAVAHSKGADSWSLGTIGVASLLGTAQRLPCSSGGGGGGGCGDGASSGMGDGSAGANGFAPRPTRAARPVAEAVEDSPIEAASPQRQIVNLHRGGSGGGALCAGNALGGGGCVAAAETPARRGVGSQRTGDKLDVPETGASTRRRVVFSDNADPTGCVQMKPTEPIPTESIQTKPTGRIQNSGGGAGHVSSGGCDDGGGEAPNSNPLTAQCRRVSAFTPDDDADAAGFFRGGGGGGGGGGGASVRGDFVGGAFFGGGAAGTHAMASTASLVVDYNGDVFADDDVDENYNDVVRHCTSECNALLHLAQVWR